MKEKKMINYIWPIALVVLSNVVYHICAKSVPDKLDPFLSLVVTYLVGAVFSFVMFLVFNHKGLDLRASISNINWAPFVMGIVVVGLEVGFIFAYKNGWNVSSASIVQSSVLGVALILAGALIFKEHITWNKIVGIVICLVGLIFINIK